MPNNIRNRSKDVKAVVFDYGEVLCHPPTKEETEHLASFFGIRGDQLPALLKHWE